MGKNYNIYDDIKRKTCGMIAHNISTREQRSFIQKP